MAGIVVLPMGGKYIPTCGSSRRARIDKDVPTWRQPSNERRLADGRVELVDTRRIEASALYNEDLAPVPLSRRTWTTYNYAALWISMAHCIPTYMLASGLMTAGMNWSQALFTILLGNTIVLVPILLNSHPGTKYGIPFPVFARAAYGTFGSNVPALMRALVACGWFGIQAWIGGEALHTMFKTIVPGWPTLLGAGCRRPHHHRMAVVPAVLGPEHLHHLSRHGSAARGGELGGALRADHDRRAALVGGLARRRARPAAGAAGQVSAPSANSCRCSSRR